jgi:hypothetical protein
VKGRKPKSEIRRKAEIRRPKSEAGSTTTRRTPSPFGFRPSDFLRISVFGLRIWGFVPLLSPLIAQAAFAAATNPPADAIPRLHPPRGEIAPAFWEQYGVWVIIAGALLLGVIGVVVWWLRRPGPVVVVPPAVEARQALEPLRPQAEDGQLLSRVSQILRRYVSTACGLPPGEMTTTDFCRAIADQDWLGPDLSSALGDFLRKCDERKFAPAAPAAALGAVAQALKLIELAEARRAELRQADEARMAQPAPRAYRGASKA